MLTCHMPTENDRTFENRYKKVDMDCLREVRSELKEDNEHIDMTLMPHNKQKKHSFAKSLPRRSFQKLLDDY